VAARRAARCASVPSCGATISARSASTVRSNASVSAPFARTA
jgi:hypothetical protein